MSHGTATKGRRNPITQMVIKLCLTIIYITVGTTNSHAALIEKYNVSHLDMRGGMPANFVDDMMMDSNGFVWICNYGGGLLRYDGYSFSQPMVSGSSMIAGSYSCRNVCEDRFKRLWVAFDDGTQVISLSTRQKADLTFKGKSVSDILKQAAVRTYCDSKGAVWLVTRGCIYYFSFNAQGGIRQVLKRPYSGNLPDVAVKDIDSDGSVWIAIDGGLFRLRPQGGRLVKTSLSNAMKTVSSRFITDMARFAGRTWIATNNGLYSLDSKTAALSHYAAGTAKDGKTLSHGFVTGLLPVSNRTLLVGTLHGVDILDTSTGRVRTWDVNGSASPLNRCFTNCLLKVGSQIWVGTDTEGVYRLSPWELNLRQYTHTAAQGSLSPNCVNAIYAEPNGTLWVGTVDGGLNRKAPGSNVFTHYTTANTGLTHNSVSAFTADNKRHLWVGTWGGGVCFLDLDAPERIQRLSMGAAMQDRTAYVGALEYDPVNNGVWIGANSGLYFYDISSSQLVEPFKGSEDIRGSIGSLIEKNGHLWIGCLDGAVEVNLHEKRFGGGKIVQFVDFKLHHYKLDNPKSGVVEKLSCFLQSRDGTLWLGSNEYGLYRRMKDKRDGTAYKAYTMQDGLANNSVKGMVEDNSGMIWIATSNGLSRLNPKTGLFSNYTADDGLICDQFYWNGAARSAQGVMYFGTSGGLIELNGYAAETAKSVGRLSFTRLTVDNQEVLAGSKYLAEDITTAKTIKLGEGNKSVEIDFSALDYRPKRTAAYSYRLKGFENEWLQLPPGQHSVRYTNLPSGSYTLEVKYSSDNMRGQTDMASIEIKVAPYFYKNPFFLLLLFAAVAVASVYAYKRHVERLRRREADMLLEPIRQTLTDTNDSMTLRKRIQNILNSHGRYKASYETTAEENDSEAAQTSLSFMEKVIGIVEKNYKYADFGVAELSEAVGMSSALLTRKLNVEAGIPASKFINNYRLNIARELLEKNTASRNVAEIAYSVGFNDPKYFSRCFTREYGVSPIKYGKLGKNGSVSPGTAVSDSETTADNALRR